jgi:toxin ParE1/3/4
LRLILTTAAEADLRDIFRYSKLTLGTTVAVNYVATINAKIALIVTNPQIGRRFDAIDDDMRRTACLRHHIYFRSIGDELRIVRVLHQRMEASRHLE